MKKKIIVLTSILIPLLFSCATTKPDINIDLPGTNDDAEDNNSQENDENIQEQTPKDLTIFSVNDNHGDLIRDPDVDSSGLDGISYLMKKEIKEKRYSDPLFLCMGDAFQGQYVSNITYGRAVIDCFNYLKLDAFVLGNHEFDWTLEKMHEYKDNNIENGELNCDILCANLIQKDINKRPDWIKPYSILESNGHKVGLIGFIGENLESSILASNVANYEFTPVLPLAKKYAKELRNSGCDTVIVGIHDYDTNLFKSLAEIPEGIDGIFGGHTHQLLLDNYTNALGNTMYAVQGGCNNNYLTTMHFTYDESNKIETSRCYNIENICEGASTLDLDLKNLIDTKYAKEIRESNYVLASEFQKGDRYFWGRQVSNMLATSEFSNGAKIGIINTGGIRTGNEYKSNNKALYYKQLYRILPFDNKIYQIKLPKKYFMSIYENNFMYSYFDFDLDLFNGDYLIANVVDYVYDGAYNRNIWDNCEKINTLTLNIREYVAKSINKNIEL